MRDDEDPEKLLKRFDKVRPEGWRYSGPSPAGHGEWEFTAFGPGDWQQRPIRRQDPSKAGSIRRVVEAIEALGLPPASAND